MADRGQSPRRRAPSAVIDVDSEAAEHNTPPTAHAPEPLPEPEPVPIPDDDSFEPDDSTERSRSPTNGWTTEAKG